MAASKVYLLDTSALLAFMEKEEGDDRVKFILKNETVLIPWLALANCSISPPAKRERKLPNYVTPCLNVQALEFYGLAMRAF